MTKMRILRTDKGLTQYEAAAKIGVPAPVLCRLETGLLTRVTKDVEEKLLAFFGEEWTFEKLMEEVKVK